MHEALVLSKSRDVFSYMLDIIYVCVSSRVWHVILPEQALALHHVAQSLADAAVVRRPERLHARLQQHNTVSSCGVHCPPASSPAPHIRMYKLVTNII